MRSAPFLGGGRAGRHHKKQIAKRVQHKQQSHLRPNWSSSSRASRIQYATNDTLNGLKQCAINHRPRTEASAKKSARRVSWTVAAVSSPLSSDARPRQLSLGRAIDDTLKSSPPSSAGIVASQRACRSGLRSITPRHKTSLLDLHPSPGSSATPSPNPAPVHRKSVVKKKISSNRRRSTFGSLSRSSAGGDDGEFPDPDRRFKTGSRKSSTTTFEEEPSIVDLLDSDDDGGSRSSAPASPAFHANPEGSGKPVDVFFVKTWQRKNPRGTNEVPKSADFLWRDAILVRRAWEYKIIPCISSLYPTFRLSDLVVFSGLFCAASSLPGTRRQDPF